MRSGNDWLKITYECLYYVFCLSMSHFCHSMSLFCNICHIFVTLLNHSPIKVPYIVSCQANLVP